MARAFRCSAALFLTALACADDQPLVYARANIVNSATNVADALAPNTLVTIYGANLAFSTRAISIEDIQTGMLPSRLAGVEVELAGGDAPASLYYVSPRQINLLLPPRLLPGQFLLTVVRDGRAGPTIPVTLAEVAPSLFQMDAHTVVSTHANGKVLTADSPGVPGEVIVLYASGLGRTSPDAISGVIPIMPAPIRHLGQLRVLLNGKAIDNQLIQYAGATPGFAGLYQVNLRLPDKLDANPDIQLAMGDQISPSGVRVPARAR